MDPAFMPTELVVKHFVHHKFTLDLGPSIINLGRPIRNCLLGVVVIYCVTDIVRSAVQAVLYPKHDHSRGNSKTLEE